MGHEKPYFGHFLYEFEGEMFILLLLVEQVESLRFSSKRKHTICLQNKKYLKTYKMLADS